MRIVAAALIALFPLSWIVPRPAAADLGDCGQPVSTGPAPTATDALTVLRVAIGSGFCELAVCDVDATCTITATDSLRLLQHAIDPTTEIDCDGRCNMVTSSTVTVTTTTASTTTTAPPAAATWTQMLEIFERNNCTLLGCHSSGTFSGELGGLDDFDAGHDALVGADVFCAGSSFSALVVPGDPDASFLVDKIVATPECGALMPFGVDQGQGGLPPVPPEDVAAIRSWILAGAPKN